MNHKHVNYQVSSGLYLVVIMPAKGRYKAIREMVKTEAEMELMMIVDRESRKLRDYYRALSTIGRVVLGYKGRKIARERRKEARLEEVRECLAVEIMFN